MKDNVWVWIPENLDIDALLDKHRNEVPRNFNKDKALYIVSEILKARSKQRKRMLEEDRIFANVSSKKLQSVISDYLKYMEFFLSTGLLCTDNQYIPGEKSKGYCLNDLYSGQVLKKERLTNAKLIDAIHKYEKEYSLESQASLWGYGYMHKWWKAKKLKINERDAIEWMEEYTKDKISKIDSDADLTNKAKLIKQAKDTCEDFKQLIRSLNGKTHIHFRGDGHRLYTPITNLKKELRQFLTYDDSPLVEIDIKNSQPFFSIALFDKNFWKNSKNKIDEKLSLERLSKELCKDMKRLRMYDYITMSENNDKSEYQQGFCFKKYIDLVVSGEFYDYIERHFKPLHPTRFFDRDSVKKEILRILFMDPKKDKQLFYSACKTFKKHFPEVYSLFVKIKSNAYNALPLILQRIESFLVLDIVCKRISKEYPEIPLFTIHDSILTTVGNEHIVNKVLKEEIKKYVGYEPNTRLKLLNRQSQAA